jgi:hypothetical protein
MPKKKKDPDRLFVFSEWQSRGDSGVRKYMISYQKLYIAYEKRIKGNDAWNAWLESDDEENNGREVSIIGNFDIHAADEVIPELKKEWKKFLKDGSLGIMGDETCYGVGTTKEKAHEGFARALGDGEGDDKWDSDDD